MSRKHLSWDSLNFFGGVAPIGWQIHIGLGTCRTQYGALSLASCHDSGRVMSSSCAFEHLEIAPFSDHAQKLFVSILGMVLAHGCLMNGPFDLLEPPLCLCCLFFVSDYYKTRTQTPSTQRTEAEKTLKH
jgi:hypothetical protein